MTSQQLIAEHLRGTLEVLNDVHAEPDELLKIGAAISRIENLIEIMCEGAFEIEKTIVEERAIKIEKPTDDERARAPEETIPTERAKKKARKPWMSSVN